MIGTPRLTGIRLSGRIARFDLNRCSMWNSRICLVAVCFYKIKVSFRCCVSVTGVV